MLIYLPLYDNSFISVYDNDTELGLNANLKFNLSKSQDLANNRILLLDNI